MPIKDKPTPLVLCDQCMKMAECDVIELDGDTYYALIECHDVKQLIKWDRLRGVVPGGDPSPIGTTKLVWSNLKELFEKPSALRSSEFSALASVFMALRRALKLQEILASQQIPRVYGDRPSIDEAIDILMTYREEPSK